MKKLIRLLSVLLTVAAIAMSFGSCVNDDPDKGKDNVDIEKLKATDMAGSLKLDMSSDTKKEIVTVKSYIDGDTTHFNISKDEVETGVLKARYLAVNTPESTGKIEAFGKKASKYTKEKLSTAKEILVESDDSKWNLDSTGGRHLVWVWYKPADSDEFRNLNLEILENGLAIASSSANNRYGEACMEAINKAKTLKYNVYSGEKDPDMYYGEAIPLTLKELRCNIKDYDGKRVAFEGIVTMDNNNAVYVEDYDEETGMSYGMQVYYGFNSNGYALKVIEVGNRARIVATVSYYETGATYQVSDITYDVMDKDNPSNVKLISKGNDIPYTKIEADTLAHGRVEIVDENAETEEDRTKSYLFAELAMYTSVSLDNLTVRDIYTTSKEDSKSNGAMTLTCEAEDGTVISVRTVVLYDENQNLVTADAYLGKNISIKGLVDSFDGAYQIKILSAKDITVNQ